MSYHPLLDWRLALDMVWLSLDPGTPIDLETPTWKPMVEQVADSYFRGLNLEAALFGGLPAGVDPSKKEVVIMIHPLWDVAMSNFRPEVARAVREAERQNLKWQLRSIFRAVRFPYC